MPINSTTATTVVSPTLTTVEMTFDFGTVNRVQLSHPTVESSTGNTAWRQGKRSHRDPTRTMEGIMAQVYFAKESSEGARLASARASSANAIIPGDRLATPANLFNDAFSRALSFDVSRGPTAAVFRNSAAQGAGLDLAFTRYSFKVTHPVTTEYQSGAYFSFDGATQAQLTGFGLNVRGLIRDNHGYPRFVAPIPSPPPATWWPQPYAIPRWYRSPPGASVGLICPAPMELGSGSRLVRFVGLDGDDRAYQGGVLRSSVFASVAGYSRSVSFGLGPYDIPLTKGLPPAVHASWMTWQPTMPTQPTLDLVWKGAGGTTISTVPITVPAWTSPGTHYSNAQPIWLINSVIAIPALTPPAGAVAFRLVPTGININALTLDWSNALTAGYPVYTMPLGFYPDVIPAIDWENPTNWQPGVLVG